MAKMTIKQLEEGHPELVGEIQKKAAAALMAEMADAPAEKIEEKFPALYGRITARAEQLLVNRPANLKIPGFLLDINDPYGAGALRCYEQAKGVTGLHLPVVLPYADKAETAKALRSYLVRAEGAGDIARAKKAIEAMKAVGVDVAGERAEKERKAKEAQAKAK